MRRILYEPVHGLYSPFVRALPWSMHFIFSYLRPWLCIVVVALAGLLAPQGARAEASGGQLLPSVPLGPPEGMFLSLPHLDPILAPHMNALDKSARELITRRTLAEYEAARLDLVALLDAADAAVARDAGPRGRHMAEFLSATLAHQFEAHDLPGLMDRARLAVAIERQLSANGDFYSGFLDGTAPQDFITARQTGALARTLDLVLPIIDEAHAIGATPEAEALTDLAFGLAQAAFTGAAARGAVRRLRLNADATAPAPFVIQAAAEAIRNVLWLDEWLDSGGLIWWPELEAKAREAAAGARDGITAALAVIEAQGLDVAAALYPAPLSLAEVQAALRQDEALVLLVPGRIEVAVFVVTDSTLHWHRTPSDWRALLDMVGQMRADLGVPDARGATAIQRPDAVAETVQIAHRLYAELLAPAAGLLADRPRLLVVATHAMAQFPFEMLAVSAPGPDAGFAQVDWLVRHHAVTNLPAVELIAHRIPPTTAPLRYLGFGAPDYRAAAGAPFAERPVTAMVAAMPPLPEAAAEVRYVAGLFEPGAARVVTGAEANETVLAQAAADGTLGSVDVLHFATHGAARAEHPAALDAFLALAPVPAHLSTPPMDALLGADTILADGALWSREIRGLRLDARLVILSACNSAVPDSDTLSGYGGLAAAFLEAGAQRVMATHWPVNSFAAVEIVTAMMATDPQLVDPAVALQEAVLGLIDRGGVSAHPAYWAPFSVIGAP